MGTSLVCGHEYFASRGKKKANVKVKVLLDTQRQGKLLKILIKYLLLIAYIKKYSMDLYKLKLRNLPEIDQVQHIKLLWMKLRLRWWESIYQYGISSNGFCFEILFPKLEKNIMEGD